MKYFLNLFLFLFLQTTIFSYSGFAKKSNSGLDQALKIVETNITMLDSINQLLVVFSEIPQSNTATLVAMEKIDKVWVAKSDPIYADIGRNGFAAPGMKQEGDGKSPTGFFRLGKLFCYERNTTTRMPFIQTSSDDKWIDDPKSNDYNRYVRGETKAHSYENLKIRSDAYKYCMVIEYNTNPVVKGMGSAIFLHLGEEKPVPTNGCVALSEKNMEWLLKWMNPGQKPSIIMGDQKVLLNGIKR